MHLYSLFVLLGIAGALAAPAKPHLIFVLTDDQDLTLGSMDYMPKTTRLLGGDHGVVFDNMIVATPICCPSRASFLSGRFQHNTRTYQNGIPDGCSSDDWQRRIEANSTMSVFLKHAGYATSFAGKYLNAYGNPKVGGLEHVPAGWDHWVGLQGNSRYYDYAVSMNGKTVQHGHDYEHDYFTDLVKNTSLSWIDSQLSNSPDTPLFAMLSSPACHGPNDPAPQYSTLFPDAKAPRTPNWNTATKGKHWLVWEQGTMNESEINYSDLTFRRRLQVLQSVDDMVEDVVELLRKHNALDNTYIIYTGDNGYHLGNFAMPYDKRLPYEENIRLPLYVRTPHASSVPRRSPLITQNIDIAPTLLDLAGVSPLPPSFDGRSFASALHPAMSPPDSPPRKDCLTEYWGQDAPTHIGNNSFSTPPFYTGGPFFWWQDSVNNTWSCVRTLNDDENSIFCDYYRTWDDKKTNTFYHTEFFDMHSDPYQLNNTLSSLPSERVSHYRKRLDFLRSCVGAQCNDPA